jgi:hypothetical protein
MSKNRMKTQKHTETLLLLNGRGVISQSPTVVADVAAFITVVTAVAVVVAVRAVVVEEEVAAVRTMCGSRTGGWSLRCVMSD